MLQEKLSIHDYWKRILIQNVSAARQRMRSHSAHSDEILRYKSHAGPFNFLETDVLPEALLVASLMQNI